jgi:hypothetical protein
VASSTNPPPSAPTDPTKIAGTACIRTSSYFHVPARIRRVHHSKALSSDPTCSSRMPASSGSIDKHWQERVLADTGEWRKYNWPPLRGNSLQPAVTWQAVRSTSPACSGEAPQCRRSSSLAGTLEGGLASSAGHQRPSSPSPAGTVEGGFFSSAVPQCCSSPAPAGTVEARRGSTSLATQASTEQTQQSRSRQPSATSPTANARCSSQVSYLAPKKRRPFYCCVFHPVLATEEVVRVDHLLLQVVSGDEREEGETL